MWTVWLDLLDNLIMSTGGWSQDSPNSHFAGLSNPTQPWAPWWSSLTIGWSFFGGFYGSAQYLWSECRIKGDNPFPGLLALLLLIQPRVQLALAAARAPLNSELALNLYHCKRFFLPVGRAFVLVGFHQAPVSSSIPAVWNPLVLAQPGTLSAGAISLASPDNLLRAGSISSFRASAQELNRTSPRRDPELLTGLQAECDPLTPTLWVQPHKHIFVPIPCPHPNPLSSQSFQSRKSVSFWGIWHQSIKKKILIPNLNYNSNKLSE